jgi:cyclopropane-fatty-acyl-phospholipid synthase
VSSLEKAQLRTAEGSKGPVVPAPPAGGIKASAMKRATALALRFTLAPLRVELPSGEVFASAQANEDSPTMVIHDDAFFARCVKSGKVGFGESFMAGEWSAEDLPGVLAAWALSLDKLPALVQRIGHLSPVGRRTQEPPNTIESSRRNIEHHYDLSNDLFETFLDASMTYSCGVFEPGDTLEEAQARKRNLLLDDLQLDSGHHLLEIGTGWGSMAIHAARRFGCRVTSLTISVEQRDHARTRIAQAGLSDLVDVRLVDYRHAEGRFDRIVSVEMFEAVGSDFWATFFAKLRDLLADGGRIALQTITMPGRRYRATHNGYGWINKYIFPGGEIPSIDSLDASLRKAGLHISHDREIGSHYATTLEAWRTRFNDNLDTVRALGFSDGFARMWDFYLAYCEAGFTTKALGNSQLVLLPG